MYKLNTQLPPVFMQKKPFLEKQRIYGAIFLFVVFTGLIYIIYEWKYKPSVSGHACIQVITTARNPVTGELVEFPNPCVVPADWEKILNSVQ
jgi:hypothetical protein